MDLDNRHYRIYFFAIVAAMLLITAVSYLVRPLSPVNETLYTGIAWDMWNHHHLLVPLIDGHTYNQKPPLFFWLLELGWMVFGVNNWWPMLLPALCSLGAALLTATIAGKLFPRLATIRLSSALILTSMAYWIYYVPRARLDQLLTLCVVLSLYGLSKSLRQERYGFLLFGLGNGLGLLTKGPICFIFTLTPLILAPFFLKGKLSKQQWFIQASGSIIISITIVAMWALPIIIQHPHYAKSILWDQTAERLAHTHHVQIKVWYYYIIRLPLLIMPWLLWPTLWKGIQRVSLKKDPLFNWLCISSLVIFCILSFVIAQKGSRFLIPLMPLLAILIAYYVSHANYHCPTRFHHGVGIAFIILSASILIFKPIVTHYQLNLPALTYYHGWWGLAPLTIGILWLRMTKLNRVNMTALIAISSYCITLLLYGIVQHMHTPNNNMQPIGTLIRHLQNQQHPIAFIGTYDDRFQFPGHIIQSITSLENSQQIKHWIHQHPNGYLIETLNIKDSKPTVDKPLYQQLYRHKQLIRVWKTQAWLKTKM